MGYSPRPVTDFIRVILTALNVHMMGFIYAYARLYIFVLRACMIRGSNIHIIGMMQLLLGGDSNQGIEQKESLGFYTSIRSP